MNREELIKQLEDIYRRRNTIRQKLYGGKLAEEVRMPMYAELRAINDAIENLSNIIYQAG